MFYCAFLCSICFLVTSEAHLFLIPGSFLILWRAEVMVTHDDYVFYSLVSSWTHFYFILNDLSLYSPLLNTFVHGFPTKFVSFWHILNVCEDCMFFLTVSSLGLKTLQILCVSSKVQHFSQYTCIIIFFGWNGYVHTGSLIITNWSSIWSTKQIIYEILLQIILEITFLCFCHFIF